MAQVIVAVIGLKKLGASFGLALRALKKQPNQPHQFTVIGYDKDPATLKTAAELGAVDQQERSLVNAVEKADLVITALPYNLMQEIFEVIGPALKAGAVVMDTSLLKQPPIAWANKYFRRNDAGELEAYLVGVTPMFNAEHLGDSRDGTTAARADLFHKGLMIISPAADCPAEAVQLVADVTSLLGIKAHFVDPVEHDGIIAAMEGLPLIVQLALFRSLSGSPSWDDLRWFGNPAFFLTTYQLEQHTAESAGTMLHENRQNVLHRLDKLIDNLTEIRVALASGDMLTVAEAFETPIEHYEKWRSTRRENEWDQPEAPTITPGFRLLGGLMNPLTMGRRGKNDDKNSKGGRKN